MTTSQKRSRRTDLKARLETFDRARLVDLIADLYRASPANRRFLDSRLFPQHGVIEEYRRMVAEAVYPAPFSRRRVSLRDATAAITQYRRATGDVTGAVDLMLTFVEAGSEQAADLGYGDDFILQRPRDEAEGHREALRRAASERTRGDDLPSSPGERQGKRDRLGLRQWALEVLAMVSLSPKIARLFDQWIRTSVNRGPSRLLAN